MKNSSLQQIYEGIRVILKSIKRFIKLCVKVQILFIFK